MLPEELDSLLALLELLKDELELLLLLNELLLLSELEEELLLLLDWLLLLELDWLDWLLLELKLLLDKLDELLLLDWLLLLELDWLLLDEEFRLLESDDSELLLESSSMSPSYRPVGVPVSPKRVSGIGHQTMMNVSLFAGASVMADTVK